MIATLLTGGVRLFNNIRVGATKVLQTGRSVHESAL